MSELASRSMRSNTSGWLFMCSVPGLKSVCLNRWMVLFAFSIFASMLDFAL